MMKEKLAYAYPKIEILGVSEEDVITTSVGGEHGDGYYDDMGAWKDSWSQLGN